MIPPPATFACAGAFAVLVTGTPAAASSKLQVDSHSVRHRSTAMAFDGSSLRGFSAKHETDLPYVGVVGEDTKQLSFALTERSLDSLYDEVTRMMAADTYSNHEPQRLVAEIERRENASLRAFRAQREREFEARKAEADSIIAGLEALLGPLV